MASPRSKVGVCLLCGSLGKLTLEHLPPRSSGNDKWTYVHTVAWLMLGSKHNKNPPVMECRRGMGTYSLCERCNGWTGRWYNDAFMEWTFQAQQYAAKVDGENSVYLTFRIQPLNVLK